MKDDESTNFLSTRMVCTARTRKRDDVDWVCVRFLWAEHLPVPLQYSFELFPSQHWHSEWRKKIRGEIYSFSVHPKFIAFYATINVLFRRRCALNALHSLELVSRRHQHFWRTLKGFSFHYKAVFFCLFHSTVLRVLCISICLGREFAHGFLIDWQKEWGARRTSRKMRGDSCVCVCVYKHLADMFVVSINKIHIFSYVDSASVNSCQFLRLDTVQWHWTVWPKCLHPHNCCPGNKCVLYGVRHCGRGRTCPD